MRWGEDFFVACALIAIVIFLVVNFLKLACGMRNNCKRSRNRESVRPAAVYTIASDPRGNQSTNNFTDFFWDVSPQNTRSNQEKDEKDLPSYEEVMRMEMERQVMDSRVQAPTTTLALPNTVETVSAPVRLTV